MKATEIQCGDIIFVDGKPTMVYGVMKRMNRIYDTMTNDISLKRCSGIPLISKILEKNGFVKGYNKWDKEETSDDVFYPYEIHLEDEGHFLYCEIKTYDAFMQIKICDIHEFQHALRLCGLNDLADNFQI